MEAAISRFDVLLTACGLRISPRLLGSRRLCRIVTLSARLVLTAVFLIALTMLVEYHSLVEVQRILEHASGGLLTLYLAIRIRKIRRLLVSVRSGSYCNLHSCSQSASAAVVVLQALAQVALTTAARLSQSPLSQMSSLTAVLALLRDDWVITCVLLVDYRLMHPLLYVHVLRLVTLFEESRLKQLTQRIQEQQVPDYGHLMRAAKGLDRARQSFDQLFNLIPFTLFALSFLSIPNTIANLRTQLDLQGIKMSSHILTHLMTTAVMALLVWTADRSQARIRSGIREVRDALEEKHASRVQTLGYQGLVDQLTRYEGSGLTGGGLFSVDRRLVLSFLSAHITITVLIIQLESGSTASVQ